MSIHSLYETHRQRARAITIPTELLVVAAVAALGLIASCVALMGGGIGLAP